LAHNPQPAAIDEAVFAALFEQYKNLVYKTAFLLLEDTAEADEALQEVFVAVYHSYASYDPQKGAFSTWLHRNTVNYCLGRRRKPVLVQESQPDEMPQEAEALEANQARRVTVYLMPGATNEATGTQHQFAFVQPPSGPAFSLSSNLSLARIKSLAEELVLVK
jgi:RNA polymerase sigma factor (sigma-70 family)